VEISRCEDMAEAIKTMIVEERQRLVLLLPTGYTWGAGNQTQDRNEFLTQLEEVAQLLRSTRPSC